MAEKCYRWDLCFANWYWFLWMWSGINVVLIKVNIIFPYSIWIIHSMPHYMRVSTILSIFLLWDVWLPLWMVVCEIICFFQYRNRAFEKLVSIFLTAQFRNLLKLLEICCISIFVVEFGEVMMPGQSRISHYFYVMFYVASFHYWT